MSKSLPSLSTFADRLAHLRALSGLDRTRMSELAGLTQPHVGMFIRGKVKTPSMKTAIKLADAYGASLEWLITGKGAAPSESSVRAAIEAARACGQTPDLKTKPANTNDARPSRKRRRTRAAA